MGAAQYHHIQMAAIGMSQLTARCPQAIHSDLNDLKRRFPLKCLLQSPRFGRDADHVEHGDPARRRRACSERLELVLIRSYQYPLDHWDVVEGSLADQIAQDRVKVVALLQSLRNIPQTKKQLPKAVLAQM